MNPTVEDVICGRSSLARNHPGNLYFRSLISEYKLKYAKSMRNEKLSITTATIQAIHERGGRFLTALTGDRWSVLSNPKVFEKVGQALRENQPKTIKHFKEKKKQIESLIESTLATDLTSPFVQSNQYPMMDTNSNAMLQQLHLRQIQMELCQKLYQIQDKNSLHNTENFPANNFMIEMGPIQQQLMHPQMMYQALVDSNFNKTPNKQQCCNKILTESESIVNPTPASSVKNSNGLLVPPDIDQSLSNSKDNSKKVIPSFDSMRLICKIDATEEEENSSCLEEESSKSSQTLFSPKMNLSKDSQKRKAKFAVDDFDESEGEKQSSNFEINSSKKSKAIFSRAAIVSKIVQQRKEKGASLLFDSILTFSVEDEDCQEEASPCLKPTYIRPVLNAESDPPVSRGTLVKKIINQCKKSNPLYIKERGGSLLFDSILTFSVGDNEDYQEEASPCSDSTHIQPSLNTEADSPIFRRTLMKKIVEQRKAGNLFFESIDTFKTEEDSNEQETSQCLLSSPCSDSTHIRPLLNTESDSPIFRRTLMKKIVEQRKAGNVFFESIDTFKTEEDSNEQETSQCLLSTFTGSMSNSSIESE